MGEYADEMIDRMLDWEHPFRDEEQEPLTTEQIAEWHAGQNRRAAEEALDRELEGDDGT